MPKPILLSAAALAVLNLVWSSGCGAGSDAPEAVAVAGSAGTGGSSVAAGQANSAGSANSENPLTNPTHGPPAGNARNVSLPADAVLADVSAPDHVVGDGTKSSCTSARLVSAVAQGGVITFDCGPEPITIMMDATAKVFNDKPNLVLDGGGRVTLSGMGQRRILYMNTCDQAQVWTSAHCDNQDSPHLTVQNLTFVDGSAKGEAKEPAGGAIFASGGRLKVLNSRFFNNLCADQ
ncbi:MAG TPA: hypothetical protein VJV79_10055, partial [Polyangiaceae bacterium]|nr:hypothetical protein [Polyangiaceae bacterium]